MLLLKGGGEGGSRIGRPVDASPYVTVPARKARRPDDKHPQSNHSPARALAPHGRKDGAAPRRTHARTVVRVVT